MDGLEIRYQYVQIPPPIRGRPFYIFGVFGQECYHIEPAGDLPRVVEHFAVELNSFPPTVEHNVHLAQAATGIKLTLNPTLGLAEADDVFHLMLLERPGCREKVDGFEEVGLAMAVFPRNEVEAVVKTECFPTVVFEILERQRFKLHVGVSSSGEIVE